MEKRTSHDNLIDVKTVVLKRGMDAFTNTAKNNARLMGLDGQAALDVVLGLQRGMLFKSMTTYTSSQVCRTCITRLVRAAKLLTSR